MSFSASTPPTAKADFDAAVDATSPSPPLTTDEAMSLFVSGQAAAKALAARFDGGYPIGASISGHACSEGYGTFDSITVAVSEAAPATPPVEAPVQPDTVEPAPAEPAPAEATPGSDAATADAEFGKL